MSQPYAISAPDCQIPGLADIYMGVFGWKNNGHFVEIGAYDGLSYSNTFDLAEIGWSGVYVEPVEYIYKKCVANHSQHPRVRCLNVACMARENVYPIFHDDGIMHTLDHRTADVLHAERIVGVANSMTLNRLLKDSNTPIGFDLLVIDVEGSEPEVLASFGVGYWQPTMVIIEAHELHDNPKLRVNADYINTFFHNAKYIRIYCDSINNIYIRP